MQSFLNASCPIQDLRFSGYQQANQTDLKKLKPGTKLVMLITESDVAHCTHKKRVERVELEKVEGHQGKAYNPDTFELTQPIQMNNDLSFPLNSISSPLTPPESGGNQASAMSSQNPTDQIDLVTVKKADGQRMQFLYGEYRLGTRGPYEIQNVQLKTDPSMPPKHFQIELFLDQTDQNNNYLPIKDISEKTSFTDKLFKIGAPLYVLAKIMLRSRYR